LVSLLKPSFRGVSLICYFVDRGNSLNAFLMQCLYASFHSLVAGRNISIGVESGLIS